MRIFEYLSLNFYFYGTERSKGANNIQYNLQLTDTLKGGNLELADNFIFPGRFQVLIKKFPKGGHSISGQIYFHGMTKMPNLPLQLSDIQTGQRR